MLAECFSEPEPEPLAKTSTQRAQYPLGFSAEGLVSRVYGFRVYVAVEASSVFRRGEVI